MKIRQENDYMSVFTHENLEKNLACGGHPPREALAEGSLWRPTASGLKRVKNLDFYS